MCHLSVEERLTGRSTCHLSVENTTRSGCYPSVEKRRTAGFPATLASVGVFYGCVQQVHSTIAYPRFVGVSMGVIHRQPTVTRASGVVLTLPYSVPPDPLDYDTLLDLAYAGDGHCLPCGGAVHCITPGGCPDSFMSHRVQSRSTTTLCWSWRRPLSAVRARW